MLKNNCTNSPNVSHPKLERAFMEYIAQIEDCSKAATVNLYPDAAPFDHTSEIESITLEIGQLEKKSSEIMSLYVASVIDFDTYQSMVKLGSQQRMELESRLNRIKNDEETNAVHYSASDIVANICENWRALNNEQRLQFVQKFIKKMAIHGESYEGQYFNRIVIDEIVFNEF